MRIVERVSEWVAGLRYEDLPPGVVSRARLQRASVLGAIFAGARTPQHAALTRAAARWGSGEDASLIPGGDTVPLHTACYVNAAASIALDYDDYLFAGHTGHSSIVPALALGEMLDARGRDIVTAHVAANEVAGRLGAAMLLGPHNGQMWAYIHALAGACVAGRFLGLNARGIGDAIGLALAQPAYPLAPAFFGPDSKMTLASGPLVEGIRAAQLAAEGLTGARDVIGEPGGMLEKMATRALPFVFEALGSAWVTESLAFKVMPGCAYIDTPVEAMQAAIASFDQKHGRALAPEDIESVRVEATLFTAGMDQISAPYVQAAAQPRAIHVNFSTALSIGVLVACGELSPEALSDGSLRDNLEAISQIAERVRVTATDEMNAGLGGLGHLGIDMARLFDPSYTPTLEGVDFGTFEMRFPARVTLTTTTGEEYTAEVEIPRGAPGRPLDETDAAVREKFLRNARGAIPAPERALDAVLALDEAGRARDVIALLQS